MATEILKRSHLGLFFRRLKSFWLFLLAVFLCDAFITVIGMLTPLFSVIIFDYAYPNRDILIFTIFTLVGFLIYFLNFIFSAYIDYMNIYVHQKLHYDITMELFNKVENLPFAFLNRIKVGDLSVRLTQDVGMIVRFIVNAFSELAMNLIKLTIFLYITLSFNPKVTLMALLSIPLYIIETKFFSKKLETVQEETQEADSELLDGIQSKLVNIRTIKAFNQQANEAAGLGVRLRRTFILSIKESVISIANVFANSLTIQVWSVFIGWYLGYQVINGALTIGELIALSIYIPMLQEPISDLASMYREYRITTVSSRRVASILAENEEDVLGGKGPDLKIEGGEVSFDNVTFGYSDEIKTIENFSLDIEPTSSVAFVGDSGSGKSTLLNLILRFFTPQDGRILIDSQDINDVSLLSLRENLGVVFQETAVVPGTIRDNILYGITNKSEEDVIMAAKDAHAHEFIKELDEGYDTYVMPQGRNLSGGQQQRLAIARILLRDPKIFILDEPTSALDPASEYLIQEAINKLIGSRTLIIVAHRLSTIKKIQRIVVIRKGKIVEHGGFNELMEKKGEFFKLYNMQYGGLQKFVENFNSEFQRVLRYDQDFTLAMIDVEGYEKLAKDHHQHIVSRYMEELNLQFKKRIRIMDNCSVYLNNRIVVSLPETDSKTAKLVIARLIETLEKTHIQVDGHSLDVRMRAGIVSCKEIHAQYGEDLFEYAGRVLAETSPETKVVLYGDIVG